MAKNLVIVESPAKAKTIGKFLGKDFEVKSSFGHIRDLPKKGLNIDLENNFAPAYEISSDKKKVVSELKKAALSSSEVWLASDEDREGEAIAWHLTQALKLKPEHTKRIVFHEITRSAIETAIANPRQIDINLVNAQQARRVLDRLVGYELSPVLWKKVRGGLSAGRVQSVAVRLIVEREREIRDFQPESCFKINALFIKDAHELPAELDFKPATVEIATSWLQTILSATFKVKDIITKPGVRTPSAPFTTSSLQQEAYRRLGYSVRQTMTLAQRLYEAGQITYMRTDSTTLSEFALQAAQKYITANFGANYHHQIQYKTKNASAQEAHEAIRPTNFELSSSGSDDQQRKLYQLIWQRTIASQMSAAQLERTTLSISISDHPEIFLARGEVLKFDGFMKVYGGTKEDTILPSIGVNEVLRLQTMTAIETFGRSPARYSEAGLVRRLEELGIGRPSTYAPTISTIQTRGYVEKKDLEGTARQIRLVTLVSDQITPSSREEISGADHSKLFPTAIAEITTDFLVNYFPTIVDYDFTARVEEDFDRIAEGNEQWTKMIKKFYDDFHPLVEQSNEVSRQMVSQARLIGTDPNTKLPIYARFGRYGPMLQRGETDDETKKPDFAPLPSGTTMDTVNLDQALVMFSLPRNLGTTDDGEEISANIGRFGPYIKVGKTFVSIKDHDPHTVTKSEALKFYATKLVEAKEKNLVEFSSGLKILRGPYGPYVTDGKTNARIPKDQDPKKISEAAAKSLLDAAPAKKRSFRRSRSS
ncbi:MAG TPA: type I DNA topoisomerase [Candidatus Dormibacteraeota bacterium]|nr:type I DNA topoisomerase [Candidatus Dormibacteraeota bacterium]